MIDEASARPLIQMFTSVEIVPPLAFRIPLLRSCRILRAVLQKMSSYLKILRYAKYSLK